MTGLTMISRSDALLLYVCKIILSLHKCAEYVLRKLHLRDLKK